MGSRIDRHSLHAHARPLVIHPTFMRSIAVSIQQHVITNISNRTYELHDSIEHPARCLAQSGRFSA